MDAAYPNSTTIVASGFLPMLQAVHDCRKHPEKNETGIVGDIGGRTSDYDGNLVDAVTARRPRTSWQRNLLTARRHRLSEE